MVIFGRFSCFLMDIKKICPLYDPSVIIATSIHSPDIACYCIVRWRMFNVCDLVFFTCDVKGVRFYEQYGRRLGNVGVLFEPEPTNLQRCMLSAGF